MIQNNTSEQNYFMYILGKGQLISKGLFVFSILPKDERNISATVKLRIYVWTRIGQVWYAYLKNKNSVN